MLLNWSRLLALVLISMQMTPNCTVTVPPPILLSWRLEFFELLTQSTNRCPRTGSLSQYEQDTIHMARNKAQSCQERYRSPFQSTSIPDWTYIREEPLVSSLTKNSPWKIILPNSQSCNCQLRRIRAVRHSLTQTAIQTLIGPCLVQLVHAFVCTRIDFANSLLYGTSAYLLDRLQSVLNSAARLILKIGKYDPISSAIRRGLHWLPIRFRVHFKINSITSNCLAGRAPEYLTELCHSVNDIPARRNLRSSSQVQLLVPRFRKERSGRSSRFLRLLTTAMESASCRYPTSPRRTSTF